MPGKAKDLRKATTLHKSLLPLAAFVIEIVAYMEMPWQNIFLLLQLILLLLLLFHFPRLLYARLDILSFLSRICFINKAQNRTPSAAFSRSLSCSPSLLVSLFVWLSLSGLVRVCVCVLKLSGVCQFISFSIQFFASLGSQLNFIGDAGFSFVCSIVLKFPSSQVPASTLSYKN